MKKQYFIILLFGMFSWLANAQTNKRQWMLGTTIGLTPASMLDLGLMAADNHAGVIFNNTNTKTNGIVDRSNSTLVSIAPSVGYFVTKGFMVNLSANFSFSKTDLGKTSYTAITPGLRYYFLNSSKIRPFLGVRGGIINRKLPNLDSDVYPVFGGQGGAAIFLNDNVSLDMFLDYSYIRDRKVEKQELPETTNSALGFGLGFSFFW